MKNLSFITLTAILMFVSINACSQKTVTGNKNYITRTYKAENFHSIRLNGSPDVYYTQSNTPSIEVYGADNIVPLLDLYVDNGTLIVQFQKNTSISNIGKLEIRVASPTLKMAEVRGSGDIHFPNGLKGLDALTLRVSGSGDIEGKKIECNSLKADVNGSGDIDISELKAGNAELQVNGSGDIDINGQCNNGSYYVNGSGDISASGLAANNVNANVNGSGDISCHAVTTLTGKVNGSGDVRYKGNPEISWGKKGLSRM